MGSWNKVRNPIRLQVETHPYLRICHTSPLGIQAMNGTIKASTTMISTNATAIPTAFARNESRSILICSGFFSLSVG